MLIASLFLFISLVMFNVEWRKAIIYTSFIMFIITIYLVNVWPHYLDDMAIYIGLLVVFYAAIGVYFSLRHVSKY